MHLFIFKIKQNCKVDVFFLFFYHTCTLRYFKGFKFHKQPVLTVLKSEAWNNVWRSRLMDLLGHEWDVIEFMKRTNTQTTGRQQTWWERFRQDWTVAAIEDSGSSSLVRLHIEGSVGTERDAADQDMVELNSSPSLIWTVPSALYASLCLSSWWEVLTRSHSWSVGVPSNKHPPLPPWTFGFKLFLRRSGSVLRGHWPEEIGDLGCPFSRAWRDAFQRAASNHGSCPFTWHQFCTEPEVCPLGRRIIFYVLTFLSAMTVITKHTRRFFFSLFLSLFFLSLFPFGPWTLFLTSCQRP